MAAATMTSALQPKVLSKTNEEIEAATTQWLDWEMFYGKGNLQSQFDLLPTVGDETTVSTDLQ